VFLSVMKPRQTHSTSQKKPGLLLHSRFPIGKYFFAFRGSAPFGEDKRAIRSQYGAENFALVTRFALSLLKKHAGVPSTNKDKQTVRRKKKLAMWSDSYFLTVLNAGFPEI